MERVFDVGKLLVTGGARLSGRAAVQGSKNSSLPILAATLMCADECVIHNCPRLTDVEASLRILRYLGCRAKREGNTLIVNTRDMSRYDIPSELMHRMRSSIIFLGAVLARCHKARLSSPGGCELGPRPIDLHLNSLRQMGIEISEEHGMLECAAHEGLRPANIALSFPSVGATENIMLAAVMCDGTTVITNAAREPEIVDLADFLIACGARIDGAGEGTVIIEGVKELHGATHAIIPDRIVAATLMSAAAVTRSKITLEGVCPGHLSAVTPVFVQAGCEIDYHRGELTITAPYRLKAPKLIRTMPYPGFPTDAQAPVMSMAAVADGMTVFVENMFASRYKHITELNRLGANIRVEGRIAVVDGVKQLLCADVAASDLRGAAALTVAALCAQGESRIEGLSYLERGYEDFELVLGSLGADIKKI